VKKEEKNATGRGSGQAHVTECAVVKERCSLLLQSGLKHKAYPALA